MFHFESKTDPRLVELLNRGGIAVLRTDTLYGVVARAADEAAVERIYQLKDRTQHKPCIVLVADIEQLFDPLTLDVGGKWPGPVSIILPSPQAPAWLKRGGDTVAYRLPDDAILRHLLRQTGPLIAPSANPEGEAPALTISEAEAYFGREVDAYVDEGVVADDVPPSQLWKVGAEGWERLR